MQFFHKDRRHSYPHEGRAHKTRPPTTLTLERSKEVKSKAKSKANRFSRRKAVDHTGDLDGIVCCGLPYCLSVDFGLVEFGFVGVVVAIAPAASAS